LELLDRQRRGSIKSRLWQKLSGNCERKEPQRYKYCDSDDDDKDYCASGCRCVVAQEPPVRWPILEKVDSDPDAK
jgi:hypothetical protein